MMTGPRAEAAPVYDVKRIGEIRDDLQWQRRFVDHGSDLANHEADNILDHAEYLLAQLEAAWAYIRRLHHVQTQTQGYCRHERIDIGFVGLDQAAWCRDCGRHWEQGEIRALLRAADRLAVRDTPRCEDAPAYTAGEAQSA